MDFFSAQDRALRKSRWLVLWLILAVVCIVTVIYLCVSLWIVYDKPQYYVSIWNGPLFFWIFILVGGGITAASFFKIWQISRLGGTMIARQLGGRMVARGTSDPAEKRLLNVIDEMAIAAGIPAPQVFVLDEEPGLNAFAAGLSMRDGVVGVTRGLLDAMTRDELQGVIGHEISHLVNGDSRLYLKLIGILFGIYAITLAGRTLAQARGRNSLVVILFGFALCAIGFIGLFFGHMIQAAVSREREYLADASAVQFTRNPAGLAAALDKLRDSGSEIQHPQAVTTSHLFFGTSSSSASFLASLFATHPPLADRICRLNTLPVQSRETPQPSSARPQSLPLPGLPVGIPEEIQFGDVTQAQSLLASLPESLRRQARFDAGATGIIAGLFLSEQSDIRLQQEKLLPPTTLPTAHELYQWLSSQPERGAQYRIVWLDLALPILREKTETERNQLLTLATNMIRANGKVGPSGFALYSLLRTTLLSSSAQHVNRNGLRADRLDQDIANLLMLIACAGNEDPKIAKAAYQAAIACSPASTQLPFPEKTALSLPMVCQALSHLALTAPLYRKKLLDACAVAVRHDGKVTPVENELLRAFARNLDCPAPL